MMAIELGSELENRIYVQQSKINKQTNKKQTPKPRYWNHAIMLPAPPSHILFCLPSGWL